MALIRLHKYGVMDLGADLMWADDPTLDLCASHGWHLRVLIDARWEPGQYVSALQRAYERRVSLLPVLAWTENGGPYAPPRGPAERSRWPWFCATFDQVCRYIDAGRGVHSNIYEVWNEPNSGGFWDTRPTLDDYWDTVYRPARDGILGVNGGAAFLVGGLAFGTEDTNGVGDASHWIGTIQARGYAPYLHGYSVHPYGYTDPETFRRTQTQDQRVARAVAEYDRCDRRTGKPLFITETGRRTDVFSEASQKAFLEGVHDALAGRARTLANWTVRDGQDGFQTSGLHRASGAQKAAYAYWRDATNAEHAPILGSV